MADNTKELNLSEVEQVSGGMGDNGCYQVINSITGEVMDTFDSRKEAEDYVRQMKQPKEEATSAPRRRIPFT